ALDAGAAGHRLQGLLDLVVLGQLAHADGLDLGHGNAEGQLVLLEADDEQLKSKTSDFLLLDSDDHADAMGGIDDIFARLEPEPLLLRLGYHMLELLVDAPNGRFLAARTCHSYSLRARPGRSCAVKPHARPGSALFGTANSFRC